MKLVTKAVAKMLPPLRANEMKSAAEIKVPLKIFNPGGTGTWYITEANLETGEAFGWCDLGEPELGYVSLHELEAVRGRWGLKMERDMHWDPKTTLADVMSGKAR